jgi:hypothetical protein
MSTTEQAGMVIVSAQISAEQRAELVRLAAEADRTLSAQIRRAVKEHRERTDETE